MQRHIVWLILSVSFSLLLTSCHSGEVKMEEDAYADARMEQIAGAVRDQDKEAMRLLFSKKALEGVSDFDRDIANLFDVMQGDVVSWERDLLASDTKITSGK